MAQVWQPRCRAAIAEDLEASARGPRGSMPIKIGCKVRAQQNRTVRPAVPLRFADGPRDHFSAL
jgi:hypothetical protein